MATSRDVQDIVSKLSSDKAKTREEGVKLLNTWLEGERSILFCRFLSQNTAQLKLDEIPNSETWPFLVKLLLQCISLEVSGSKRRTPKSTFAKTLRIVIQRTEETKLPGVLLPLLPVAKLLFTHVYNVLSNTPSFQSEYGTILRHLLAIREYRFHMTKRTYSSLMLLYIERMGAGFREKSFGQHSQKEDAFRNILTLQTLLENPPVDFTDDLREEIGKGLIHIFSVIRDEGKLLRKLIECVNTFLLKDGPNLGPLALELHNAVQQFAFCYWFTTHDRGLKDALAFYSRVQLNLIRSSSECSSMVEQLLDVVSRELDIGSSSGSASWGDSTKDEKLGTLSSYQNDLVELAAHVLYRACANASRPSTMGKRARRQHAALCLMEALTEGKWLWNATFCCLVQNYHARTNRDLLMYWFEAICSNFQRVLNWACMRRSYDGLLWTLRGLQELSSVLLFPDMATEISSKWSFSSSELQRGWQTIWDSLIHGLSTFSSMTVIVDAALVLLGSIVSSCCIHVGVLPQEVWDHQLFKHKPSESVLYFIASYFSRMGCQGNLQDDLHLRRNILRAILGFLSWKGPFLLNERMVRLLPAAVFALCAGCTTSTQFHREHLSSPSSQDISEVANNVMKMDYLELERTFELFECSVEVLTRIHLSSSKTSDCQFPDGVQLPWMLIDPLLRDMDIYILSIIPKDIEQRPLSDVFMACAFLCHFIHGSSITRKGEGSCSFLSKAYQYLLQVLDYAVEAVVKSLNDLRCLGSLGLGLDLNKRSSVIVSLTSLMNAPFFTEGRDENSFRLMYDAIIQSLERLLTSFSQVYIQYTEYARNLQSEILPSRSSAPDSPEVCRIVDMELDVSEDTKDADIAAAGGKAATGMPVFTMNWKLGMISLISSFSFVHPFLTWDILYNLMEKECDPKVLGNVLYHLCLLSCMPSVAKIMDLVNFVESMINMQVKLKLNCLNMVTALHVLLGSLLSLGLDSSGRQRSSNLSLKGGEADQLFEHLGVMVNKVAELGCLDWFGRVRVIHCICNFVLLAPQIGQTMIERLLSMINDPDYRVRFVLARQIGLLFQTWDGHEALFQDICSNSGVVMVVSSKKNLVTATDVLAAGPQPRPKLETFVITLMHLAYHSEKIELEAVFKMCVFSAIDTSQRELVTAALDSLSMQLDYPSRFKYLEELLGPILFCWIACDVSLAALVETRQLFILDAEPNYFIQSCSQWLLPALLLRGDHTNLDWVAKIAGQTLAVMVKEHFVPIFSVCMGLHHSKTSECEKGAAVLQNSILHVGEITENERDELIKQNMVSIVGFILSLTSCSSEPPTPSFSRDTIARAIQTVVDGFLEVADCPTNAGVIDRINIFRPDRVFMFITEMHYRVSAASHHRHTCHHLAAIEVLASLLGHRASVPSSFNYLFNLVGQFISYPALQDQCCDIISGLLDSFKSNPCNEIVSVLGEQLQFLVSRLVACCISAETDSKLLSSRSSQVLNLLHKLIIDSDPSLYDDIRDLEPFPDLDIFECIRDFHVALCRDYSPRDHLLKCAKRSCYLPPRLLSPSLRALHKKFIAAEASQKEKNMEAVEDMFQLSDNEIVNAVWTIVRMSASDEADSMRLLVSDFVSRVGIGDPHCVVFHLPGPFRSKHILQSVSHDVEFRSFVDSGISDETLTALLRVLKKYLLDDAVKIIDVTSQALRGILSTERGQRALSSFDSCERCLIEVHAKGVKLEVVEKILLNHEKKFKADGILLEKPELWSTDNKTFEAWICQLVNSLIAHCGDVTIRLCQNIALLKAEISELLLPSVIVSLAGRKETDINFHELISSQLKEHIFVESNKLTKSKQIMLDALNELRMCYVVERSIFGQMKRENSRNAKPSSYGSRSRSTAVKIRDVTTASKGIAASMTTNWDKVYWLSIDYLIVAKSALACGAYFTSFMYVEHWCEEQFGSLTLGDPDFTYHNKLPGHVGILVSAITRINEPDCLYGITQSNKIITFEHEGNWSRALEYYDLQARSEKMVQLSGLSRDSEMGHCQQASHGQHSFLNEDIGQRKPYKGLIRSLQQTGCVHVLDLYCRGLTSQEGYFQNDPEFIELQHEAAWRAGNWDFSLLYPRRSFSSLQHVRNSIYHENLHCCLRALQEGDYDGFYGKLRDTKKVLVLSVSYASEESTEFIYSTVMKLQILYHLGLAWDLRWKTSKGQRVNSYPVKGMMSMDPATPTMEQLSWLNNDWSSVMRQTQLHMNLLEPFIAFRRVLLQILGCKDSIMQHLLQSASLLRKGLRFSQAAASLHEFKFLWSQSDGQCPTMDWRGRIEEAKLLQAQGQHEVAISLANHIIQNYQLNEEASDVHRLVGKWLAETRSSNSRTVLEKYLKPAVSLAEEQSSKTCKRMVERQSQTWFRLAHYADALFRSYEERLSSSEWKAGMRLRKHKTKELEALIRRLKSSTEGEKIDYSLKIQELQKQLAMDKEEAEKLQDDKDNFLKLALEGYKRCLVIGDKYDVRVVFRQLSMWFNLFSQKNVVDNMLSTIDEVQSYKFVPLVYQIASRLGSSRDDSGSNCFQFALVSLIRKMAIDHPYHTIFQLLALANGDRVKDKQRSRNSFVVDVDKKVAAENLLQDVSDHHGPIVRQMKQMVEIYIKLAELETKREHTNKRVALPREIRSVKQLELVPVVTATVPIDRSCQYIEGAFPFFRGLSDSVTVMNGINAPKVVECLGSDGHKYKQLAKSGNDDLRQDAVMEQFFGLVNTFLQNHRDTWKRRLGVRTYKVIPFTPSAGVLEWVDGTIPLGEYLIGSSRNGGAHGRYGIGDWQYGKCREHMSNVNDKRKAFIEVCKNFRPVMHYFFLEKFLQPADWFVKRLAYARSVAASSMVGYIVGLGDRHAMNILIDQATAEVVHIDLGVAFEQGLMLKTPERVPFRLTRDIIDGMGVTGIDGVFRRCCEETLSVMRTNKEALLTIVEVFIHDPLYKWALSPLKALQRQKETDEDEDMSFEELQEEFEGNKDAARALMRVKQKLDGYEEGEMRSIHGQVQQLIQDAIDTDRLCQMFPGWAAWM